MSGARAWGVRHPGIGVLYYGSEDEARVAAGTAATMLPPCLPHRLVVPAPEGGWLTLTSPKARGRRRSPARHWRLATAGAVRAAGLLRLGPVRVQAEARPRRIAPISGWGIHHAEDVRPSMHRVFEGLVDAGVIERNDRTCVVDESLTLGVPTGEAGGQGYLVLTLRELP